MKAVAASRRGRLCRDLPSRLVEVDSFCQEVREMLTVEDLTSELFPIEMLLRESLNNAIIHGNSGDDSKKVQAEIRIGTKWIRLSVTDEGSGFKRRKPKLDPPDPNADRGRGLAIYALYAERVSFNSRGNRVTFWRSIGNRGFKRRNCK
jgi:serine/threonine-protein kinase RsbW